MKQTIEKLASLERDIASEKGESSLFALFLREDANDTWDLLAMTMLAVPSCVPISAPQQASACARALSTVTACQPHGNSSQPFAPVFAAAGLSLLPAWCAARLAGGQPGGLPSSQHWHAGAAERHAPWGHRRGARRCWRVGHVKSGLFSLYSALSQVTLRLTSSPRRPRCVSTNS